MNFPVRGATTATSDIIAMWRILIYLKGWTMQLELTYFVC